MDFHDPQVAIPVMILGAVIMVFALIRYRVLSQIVPTSEVRKFSVVFGFGWLLTLAGGLAAFTG